MSPAESVFDPFAICPLLETTEVTSSRGLSTAKSAWKLHSAAVSPIPATEQIADDFSVRMSIKKTKVSPWRQIHVLISRTMALTIRDPLKSLGTFTEAIKMGVIMRLIF